MRRAALLLSLLGVLGFALAACAGDGGDEADVDPATTSAATTAAGEPPAGDPADAVEEFVQAIEARDQNLSWALLSRETKVAFQIDRQHWVQVLMPALKKELHAGGEVVFQQRFGNGRALVVSSAGQKKTPFPAALRAEDGGWRLELFYPEFNPTRPTPGEVVAAGKRPLTLDVVRRRDKDLELRLWLDGKEIQATAQTTGNFLITYSATLDVKPGRHLLVAYASTEEGFAGGSAWEFTGK